MEEPSISEHTRARCCWFRVLKEGLRLPPRFSLAYTGEEQRAVGRMRGRARAIDGCE